MAASYHTRSNSFPSRSNPVVSQSDEQLSRLRSSEFASSSTSSSSSLNSKLTLLSGLYDCIGEFLRLPSSQKAFFQQGRKKWAEDALEGSIKLLDACSTITDVLVQMKERAQELQSILRRRCSKDEIAKEVAQYLKSRKNAMKAVIKALKDLKKVEEKCVVESDEVTEVVSRLRECQMAALSVLETILFSIAGPKATFVSKLMKSKCIANQQETEFFLVGLEASDANLHPETVTSGLKKMEISIKNVGERVEILFRHLIKTRTTILNILNC